MKSVKRYRLSRLAEMDLESIYSYTIRNWSNTQADKYYDLIVASIEDLIGGVRTGHPSVVGGYLVLRVGSHSIFYREADDIFYIVRILHQAMDTEQHLVP